MYEDFANQIISESTTSPGLGEWTGGRSSEQQRYSAINVVIHYIESLILLKKLKAGDKIPTETELSKILHLGRGSVREAVKILEANGLLVIRRGDGTYISQVEDVELSVPLMYRMMLCDTVPKELLEFRKEMELSILRMAIYNADADTIREVIDAHQQFRETCAQHPVDSTVLCELDCNFHLALAQATHNRYYQQLYKFTMKVFMPKINRNYEIGQNPGESIEVHEQIVQTLLNRDISRAEQCVEEMVKTWGSWVEKQ